MYATRFCRESRHSSELTIKMPWSVGEWVQAHDGQSGWYDARVVADRGEGDAREVKIHFNGWNKRQDQWLPATDARIIAEDAEIPEEPVEEYDWGGGVAIDAGDGQYEVERIVRKKRDRDDQERYLVQWAGLKKDGTRWPKQWLAADQISPELIDAFDNPPPPAAIPFVLTQPELVAPAIADTLAPEWLAQIGRSAATLLARQREQFACRRLYSISPCPPWLFLAIHRGIKGLAAGLEGEQVGDIRAVRGHRGGKHVEDEFVVVGTDLVEALAAPHNRSEHGHGALVLLVIAVAIGIVVEVREVGEVREVAEQLVRESFGVERDHSVPGRFAQSDPFPCAQLYTHFAIYIGKVPRLHRSGGRFSHKVKKMVGLEGRHRPSMPNRFDGCGKTQESLTR